LRESEVVFVDIRFVGKRDGRGFLVRALHEANGRPEREEILEVLFCTV